jgi:hypothetical protein
MKVIFKNMIQAYSGKCDGLVYYYNRRLGRMCVREYVKQKPTAQHGRFAAISSNLKSLDLSDGYKQNLKDYTELYLRRHDNHRLPVSNWYNVFMMLMYAMAKELGLDLATLTRNQIETEDLPCRTVKQAVEAGYIPAVLNYERLDDPL